jgi:type IV pilus assembly protein PilQ
MPEETNEEVIKELRLPVLTPVLVDQSNRKEDELDENIKNIVGKIVAGSDKDLENLSKELASDETKFEKVVNQISKIMPKEQNIALNDPAALKQINEHLNEVYNDKDLKKKISLKITNSKIEDVISLINKITPLNFIIDSDASGTIKNFNASDIELAGALKIILSQNEPELVLIKESGIYRIMKLSRVYEKVINKKDNSQNFTIASDIFIFQNQKITESFKVKIEKMWIGITNGEASKSTYYLVCDEGSRKIFFRGKEEYVKNFREYLKQIDVIVPQIKIEGRVIIANKDFEESFGLQWSNVFNRRAGIKRGVSVVGSGPLQDINNNPKPQSRENLMDWALNMFPILGEATRKLHIPFVIGGNDLNTKRLNVVLNAAENNNELKTILKPSLVTNNCEEAEILVGEQIPLEVIVKEAIEGSLRDVTTVNYKDIGIKLKVKPIVSTDYNSIFLDIYVENSFRLDKEKFPVIEISNSRSRVLLKNGQTTLIGGLLRSETQTQKTGIPYLSKIPILNFFFSGSRKFVEDKQLLIFITPSIIYNS